jgi:hypothetical protein
VQPAGGQATKELRRAFERCVGSTAADELRDRRRLFLHGTAGAQSPQAAVEAATIAGRGYRAAHKRKATLTAAYEE